MKNATFKGGIHPPDGKDFSKDKPIRRIDPGDELAFLMSQHIGAPAKPIVKKGDYVRVGDLLAEAGGFVSVPVHCSVSGEVVSVRKQKNALGESIDAVIVKNDHQYTTRSFEVCPENTSLSREEIIHRIQEAGVVGMGGAGFPTHVKLSPKDPDKIDYVLVNGSECEPYLTSDYRCMLEYPDELIDGLKVILTLFPNARGVIGIEDNKPEAIRVMQDRVLAQGDPRISVLPVQTKYPQGAERCLIYAATGRSIHSGMLPADAGCIVDNVDTVIAVGHAVIQGIPLMRRIFTISGDAVKEPGNYDVPVGMYYHEIIEAAGGFHREPEKLISGGPMMGFALYGTDIPVTKTSGAMTALTLDDVSRSPVTPCIRCGRCLQGCPEHLMPLRLYDAANHANEERFLAFHGLECVECGSCSYQCPAKRPLVQSIRTMKRNIIAKRRQQK